MPAVSLLNLLAYSYRSLTLKEQNVSGRNTKLKVAEKKNTLASFILYSRLVLIREAVIAKLVSHSKEISDLLWNKKGSLRIRPHISKPITY